MMWSRAVSGQIDVGRRLVVGEERVDVGGERVDVGMKDVGEMVGVGRRKDAGRVVVGRR